MASSIAPIVRSSSPQQGIVVARKKGLPDQSNSTYRSDAVELRILNPNVRRSGSNMSPTPPSTPSSLVAVRDIKPGEKLFAEKAFLSYDTTTPAKKQIQFIRNQMSKITRNQSNALSLFFSLPYLNTSGGEAESQQKDLLLVDRHSIQYDAKHKGVFVLVSKCRHSCAPNVEISILKDGIAVAHAINFIERGTEITRNTLGELNMSYEKRKDKFKRKYLVKCTCHVCNMCVSNVDFCVSDDTLRTKIDEAENEFYIAMSDYPHEAVSLAHKLIGVLIQSAVSEKHFEYTDIALLRRLHLRVSTLCMQNLDGSHLSVEHLKYAAAYCAVGLGWTNSETMKILSYLEKRSIPTLSLSELPIFNRNVNEELFRDFLFSSISTHERKIYGRPISRESRSSSPSTDGQKRIPDQHLRVDMPKNVYLPNIHSPLSLGTPPPMKYKTLDETKATPQRQYVKLTSQVDLHEKTQKNSPTGEESSVHENNDNVSLNSVSSSVTTTTKKVSLRIPHIEIGQSLFPQNYVMDGRTPSPDSGDPYYGTNSKNSSPQSTRPGTRGALSTVNIALDSVSDDDISMGSDGSRSIGVVGKIKKGVIRKGKSHLQSSSSSPHLRDRQKALTEDEDDISVLTPQGNDDDYQMQFNYHRADTIPNSSLSAFSIWASKNKSSNTKIRKERISTFVNRSPEEKSVRQSPEVATSELLQIKKSAIQVGSPKSKGKAIIDKKSPPYLDLSQPKINTAISIPITDEMDHENTRPDTTGDVNLSSRPNTGFGLDSDANKNEKKAIV